MTIKVYNLKGVNIMIFGDRLKEIRQKRGITQEALAKSVSISPSSISLYERGIREPNLNMLISIAKALDVSTDYLLGLTNNEFRISSELKDLSFEDIKKILQTFIDKIKQ